MNERIKDLLVVCGMPNEQIMEILEDRNQSFYMEQFTRLIIRECVRISEEDPVGDDPACCTNTSYRIARTIKKHFGIE